MTVGSSTTAIFGDLDCHFFRKVTDNGTPKIFHVPPIIPGRGKATNVRFGRYIQRVHANKSPLKIWEKMERGRVQVLPKFFEYPYYLNR